MTSPPRAGYHECALNIPRASDTWASAQDPGRVPVRMGIWSHMRGTRMPWGVVEVPHLAYVPGKAIFNSKGGRAGGERGWADGGTSHTQLFWPITGEVVVVKVIKLKVTINFKYIITWWITVSVGTIDHRSIRTREPNAWLLVVNCKVMQSPAMQGCKPICLSNYV